MKPRRGGGARRSRRIDRDITSGSFITSASWAAGTFVFMWVLMWGKCFFEQFFIGGYADTLSASDFFQYFNPTNACLQVVDLIDFFFQSFLRS